MREGYKQTEVGVIPEDWEVRPMLSAVSVASGQVDPRVEPYRSMTLVAPDHIEGGTGRLLKTESASAQRAISGKYSFRKGDVIYSKIRPHLRKAVLADFDGLCSADMYPLRPAADVSGGFVLASILAHHFSRYAESVSVRSGMPKINRSELADYGLPLPPTKAEQEAIAEALGDADALIESLEQLLAKKRQLKQGAMQELLTGKTRLPGFGGDWTDEPLGHLARIQRGASPRPIDSARWFEDGSTVGWVRISDVTSSGKFLTKTQQTLSSDGIANSRPVDRGSLIMSICATVGRPIITKIDVCIHDGFVVFDDIQVDQEFLFYTLQSIERDWYQHGQTGSQMNLNTTLINSTEVRVPPTVDEQSAIALVLSDIDRDALELNGQVLKAKDLKIAMMQELLTGRIRLP